MASEIKLSGISLPFARKHGFRISRRLWKNCTNGIERNKGYTN